MLIREVMHERPLTVGEDTTLAQAYAMMRARGYRHLPVVAAGRVVGLVTDRDLRLATSELSEKPFSPSARVGDVMSRPVHTANPLDPVESAARTMRELKIGCLPVLDGDALVGIVTGIDLLDALLRLTGAQKPSGRIEVRLADRPGEIARLTALLADRQINLHSVLSYPEDSERGRLIVRVGTIDVRGLVRVLCDAGFEVLWPTDCRCSR